MVAAAIAHNAKEFNCQKCEIKACDEDRKIEGSRGPLPYEGWTLRDPLDGKTVIFESRTCPLPTVPPRIWALFDLYRLYQRGILFRAGGIADQPHVYLDAMQTIETTEKAIANG